MIRLTEKDIVEFQKLFKQETGRDITCEQAAEYAERLIRLVAIAYGIDLFPPPEGSEDRAC